MPKSSGFVKGYELYEYWHFALCDEQGNTLDSVDQDTGVLNPFKDGTDEAKGFDEAWYDLTQK